MSALGSADLQNSSGGNLAKQSDQPDVRMVLRPFSEELRVDEELKLSRENFIQSIEDFFRHKNRTPLSQLTAKPAFPTPHVLAQFASKVYRNYKTRQTDAQYETRLALPDGWKLLTTASNVRWKNGYFGTAYWHPENQQVVIAHRGTGPTNLGALWTDVKGVLRNKYVRQMESASTFARVVVEVLRETNRMKGASFQLFFTGHLLGGWLAQVTTFTTKYLKMEGNIFLQNNDEQDCFHPHTVVFDNPGCKDMLLQMRDTFDVRLDGRSIDIEHLDITSYLSAPNRINTCNSHLGTVYRIFPGLSDMGWKQKRTLSYKVARHNMDKIVETFDPETGQVHKDEQGRLRVQVVVDWPICPGLKRGKEYENFFKWAEDSNNYHSDIKEVSFQHLCLICYQTKLYDEGVNSFSIFSEEEQEFLQCYHKLRQWPDFCKPKELFAVMKNDLAQEQAEKLLQNFEIENDTIRCTDARALQDLIPYVKRLLQLFPGIKEFRNRVYQCETSRCIELMKQSQLDFNPDALSVSEFLANKQQQVLQVETVVGDEWTGLMKVYEVLQETGCLIEGPYTILKLERLLTVNMLMDFRTLVQSIKAPYLILVTCEANQLLKAETKDMTRTVFETMKQNPFIKIILTTRSEDRSAHFLQHITREIFGNGFGTRYEQLTWCDLNSSSQEKLLEKSVRFQDVNISLNKFMSAESPVAECLSLCALLEEKELKIADPVPISNGYDEIQYIGRTLRRHIVIKQDISRDVNVKDKYVFLASAEREFKQFCQLYPNSNVHWLQKDKSGKLLWQRSQGSLATLRRYIDTDSSHTYTADDLDKLLEQALHQRVMLISDTARMDKSTVLTHLSKQIEQKFPAKWVVKIDLNDHTDTLKALKKEQIDKQKAMEIVLEKLLKLDHGLEMELFKQCGEQKQNVRIVIMLDGFDKISPVYKQTVIDLVQALRQTAVEQLWVTTRPHLRENLEDKLQQLSYTLEPFSEENQVEFLTKFSSLRDWFTEPECTEGEVEKGNLEVYAEHLINKLAQPTSDKDREFTDISLHTRMSEEAFDKDVKTFYRSAEYIPDLRAKFELSELYERFIERKYDIYQEEKLQVSVNNAASNEQRKRQLQSMRMDHQLLALKVLFTEEQVAMLQNKKECSFSAEELTRIGIVQVSHDGKPHFIHRTFADYYVADCLVNRLTEGNISEQVLDFIIEEIFLSRYFRVIRVFMDGFLLRSEASKEMLKQFGNRIHYLWNASVKVQLQLWNDGNLGEYCVHTAALLHRAVYEGNVNIIGFLQDSLQAAGHTDIYKELLLSKDAYGRTPWHQAVYSHNIKVSKMLWECAKRNPRAHDLGRELLFAEDLNKMNAWHLAVKEGKIEVLLKQWELAKEELSTRSINLILFSKDSSERTVWDMIEKKADSDQLRKLWHWAKRKLTTEEIKSTLLFQLDMYRKLLWESSVWDREDLTTEDVNKLLLASDDMARTVFHMAAKFSKQELLQEILNWAKENLTTEEVNKLLLAKDGMGWTVFHEVAHFSRQEVLREILKWAKENLTTEEVNKLLLAKDVMGMTVFHVAAESNKLEVLQEILKWAKENLTAVEVNKLLLAKDGMGMTVFHVAAMFNKLEVLQETVKLAKDKLTTKEINKLLLATDSKGRTVFHVAAEFNKLEVLHKILKWSKEKLTTEEINKWLLATDSRGRTVFHMAAEFNKLEVLQDILKMAKGKLTAEEVNKLLLATDGMGMTVVHVAAMINKLEVLQEILKLAKEKLTKKEINKLLLATDGMGRTVFHMAAEFSKQQLLQEIFNCAKETLTAEGVDKLLLATDSEGRTVFHVATEFNKLELLQDILMCAKENPTTKEIYKLLLATDGMGRTVFHMAAMFNKLEVLQEILKLAKEKLTTKEINKLLLATDGMGRTVFHMAAGFSKQDMLQEILKWAKETLTAEEVNKLLLATDRKGRTVFHVATKG
jgi:ankyrin repeat protein